MSEPSAEFERCFFGVRCGSPVADCGCGRTCFADDSPHFEPGELEQLEANPNAVNLGGESVSHGQLPGQYWVDGCPCDYASKIEEAIWNWRIDIARYIRARSAIELTQAPVNAALFPDTTEEERS